jgi:DNA-binding LacI/PurR family transcriptional regulator
VLCGNDLLAIGMMRPMREAGLAMPRGVSVIGFDDMPTSAYLSPAPTTASLDFAGPGRTCFAMLRAEASVAAGAQLPPQLIVRESVAKRRRRR